LIFNIYYVSIYFIKGKVIYVTYEELNKSNIPLITMDFIDDAIKKFSYLKDNIDNMDNIENDNDDIVDLSFLFSA